MTIQAEDAADDAMLKVQVESALVARDRGRVDSGKGETEVAEGLVGALPPGRAHQVERPAQDEADRDRPEQQAFEYDQRRKRAQPTMEFAPAQRAFLGPQHHRQQGCDRQRGARDGGVEGSGRVVGHAGPRPGVLVVGV